MRYFFYAGLTWFILAIGALIFGEPRTNVFDCVFFYACISNTSILWGLDRLKDEIKKESKK